jgi:hypothetical protein
MSYVNLPDTIASILGELDRRLYALEHTDSAYLTKKLNRIGSQPFGSQALFNLNGGYQVIPNTTVTFTVPTRVQSVLILATISSAVESPNLGAGQLCLHVDGVPGPTAYSGATLWSNSGSGPIIAYAVPVPATLWTVVDLAPGAHTADWRVTQTQPGQTNYHASLGQVDAFLLGG